MKATRFDMSAGTVTLDLAALKETLGAAVAQARNELEHQQNDIRANLEDASIADVRGESHENYLCLCHANTHREYLVRAAEQYAAAIQAYFHVCEAIKREETRILK